MRQFFLTVFGGLAAVGVGVGVAWAGTLGVKMAMAHLKGVKPPSLSVLASAVIPNRNDGTELDGWKRVIRYTASEEEDLIHAAELALPAGTDRKIGASAYLVKNLTTGGTTAAEMNADQLLPIASLTKLVTAVIARRHIDPETRVTISKEVMAYYGNTAGFRTGEIFRAEDLYYPLLMVSSNDAAEALAENHGRKEFIKAMNDFAQSIGAYRTYFTDASGLSEKNISTANDLALILDWIRKNDPEIIDITALKSKTARGHTWTNPTHFLNWSTYVGGKNGYTDEANRTTASLFTLGKNKNIFAVVALGSENRDSDIVRLLEKVK
jgi:D-alanyl-D-alanine carboxypeptidase